MSGSRLFGELHNASSPFLGLHSGVWGSATATALLEDREGEPADSVNRFVWNRQMFEFQKQNCIRELKGHTVEGVEVAYGRTIFGKIDEGLSCTKHFVANLTFLRIQFW